jgi:hypothetical protein
MWLSHFQEGEKASKDCVDDENLHFNAFFFSTCANVLECRTKL